MAALDGTLLCWSEVHSTYFPVEDSDLSLPIAFDIWSSVSHVSIKVLWQFRALNSIESTKIIF